MDNTLLAKSGDVAVADNDPRVLATEAINRWIEGLDERSSEILAQRLAQRASTLEAIGSRHGVSRERIRQIERRVEAALNDALETESEWQVVRTTIDDLRQRCGACAPIETLHDLDLDTVSGRLLVTLAGLSLDSIPGSVSENTFTLPDLEAFAEPPDGLLVDRTTLEVHLLQQGVKAAHLPHVVGLLNGKDLDGALVVWRGNIVERSLAQLLARGEPMTSAELLPLTGGQSERGLRNRLLEDDRVQRVNRQFIAPRSWGLPEYTSVVDHMLHAIDLSTEDLLLRQLADRLERALGIKTGTTISYASAPVFAVAGGYIWRRRADEPYPVSTDVSRAPGLYRTGPHSLSWLIPVDRDVTRGSGRPVPAQLAGVLGVSPGKRVVFDNLDQSVTISWSIRSHMGPTCSSLRLPAEALGALSGEHLRLDLDIPTGRVAFERVMTRPDESALDTLTHRTGLPGLTAANALTALAEALRVPVTRVAQALTRRGDRLVAAALAEVRGEGTGRT